MHTMNSNMPIAMLIATGLAHMGLSYLFPYQRLVITNILEAARAAGIPFADLGGSKPDYGPRFEGKMHGSSPRFEKETFGDGPMYGENLHIDGGLPDPDRELWAGYGRQLVILPTGAGKSLCFQLPARLLNRPTLVIFPILALMADQERRLRSQGSPVVLLRGNQTPEERETIARTLSASSNTFIIANPEVLKTAPVRRMLRTAQIAHVVIDEAHCVSQWGESFRPAYLELGEMIAELGAPLLTAFTATASQEVLEKIRHSIFSDGDVHLVMGNPDRPNISYRIVRTLSKEAALRHLLSTLPRPAIVFCSSRSRTEQLARSLRTTLQNRDIFFYHAGLEREEKKTIEAWFFTSTTGILLATCAYGMGVDKGNIRTVIHFDCPDLVEAYLQESGRGGRDGNLATATLLWGPEDEARIGIMAEYGKTQQHCRREQLLALLTGGEPGPGKEQAAEIGGSGIGEHDGGILATCTGDEHSCDICSGTAQSHWREAPALQKLIQQSPRRFTLAEASEWVAGQERLDLSREEARRIFCALIDQGTLRYSKHPLWRHTLENDSSK